MFSLQDTGSWESAQSPQSTEEKQAWGDAPGKPDGDPPSLLAVDWALSRHCSASFSIFKVSGGMVSPSSGEQGTKGWSPSPQSLIRFLLR